MEKVANIKKISYWVFLIAIISGLAIAFLWSNRSSRSLKKTFDLIPQHGALDSRYKDPFQHIQHSVYEIIRNNELLSNIIEQQISFLRTSFYQQLINGDFPSEKELDIHADYIGLDFQGNTYAACIVQVLGYGQGKAKTNNEIMQELDIRRLKVKDALLKNSFTRTYFYDVARDRIMLIFIMETENYNYYKEQMTNYIKRVREQLLHYSGIEVRFAWGELYSEPLDLTHSIQQELRILDYAQINNQGEYEICYTDFMDKQYGTFYPKEWEHRLMSFSKDGNEEKVANILKNLQVENFIRRKLTPGMLKVLLNQLYGTLMRVMQETSIEGEEIYKFGDRLNSLSDFYGFYDENFSFIVDSFIYICQVVNERKKNHSVKLMDEIRQFIQENYSDKNLSLLILAEKFNYSPAYLSLF